MKYYLTFLFLTLSVSTVLLINNTCDIPATKKVDKNCNLESCKNFCSKAQHKVDLVKCENRQLIPYTNMAKKDYCLCCVYGNNAARLKSYSADQGPYLPKCEINNKLVDCDCLHTDGEQCTKFCKQKHGSDSWGYCIARGMQCICQKYHRGWSWYPDGFTKP